MLFRLKVANIKYTKTGNSQSNERKPNYKIFEITHVDNDKNKKYIKVWLHDYVTYIDGNYKHVYLEKRWLDYLYKDGDYLEIDLNAISCEMSGHDFNQITGPVQKIGKDHVIEKRDSNGNFEGFFFKTAEFLSEMQQTRERYQIASIESWGGNIANFRQTSYDMPPK